MYHAPVTVGDCTPGTVVELAFRHITGNVLRRGEYHQLSTKPYPGSPQTLTWKAFRQGQSRLHDSTLCFVLDEKDIELLELKF